MTNLRQDLDVPCKVCGVPMDRLHGVDITTNEGFYHDTCFRFIEQQARELIEAVLEEIEKTTYSVDSLKAAAGFQLALKIVSHRIRAKYLSLDPSTIDTGEANLRKEKE